MSSEKLLYRLEQPHGPGEVYISWQKGSGSYLAITGCDAAVTIFDRYGQQQARIKLPGLCSGFGWDSDGDILAIISSSSPQVTLWDANTTRQQTIDVGLRDTMSALFWSKTKAVLAVATTKGNVAIYNHNTSKRIPVIGKHSKRITCGCWNSENLLALGSEDKTISISNVDGDTLRILSLRSEPADIQFSDMKVDERIGTENTVSVIVGKRTLYLYNLLDPENPIELAFQQHYGTIVTYKWFGDGYIMLGFSTGFFIAISTHIKEVGQELFQIRNHKTSLNDVAFSIKSGKVATCGDNTIKIHDASNLQETGSVIILEQETEIERIGWSEDGQLLAACGRSGCISLYLAQLPTLSAVCGPRIALLTGLVDIALYQYSTDNGKQTPLIISTEVEPSFIALGPYHLACGLNNRAWLYDLKYLYKKPGSKPYSIKDKEYLSAVTNMRMNAEYASVLCDGKLQLHKIDQREADDKNRSSRIFPDGNNQEEIITDHALTPDFLIYSTDMGHIIYFFLEDWKVSMEFQHSISIKKIFVDPAGTRLVFIDDKSHGYVYNPVTSDTISIPEFSATVIGVLWDNNITDRNVFVAYDEHEIITYIYIKHSINGSLVEKVGSTKLVSQQTALLLYAGELTLGTSSGQLTQLTLDTHENSAVTNSNVFGLEETFNKHLKLYRYQESWEVCEQLNKKELWLRLGEIALKNLEIDWALRIYTRTDDVAMSNFLRELSEVEDYREICGHVLTLLGQLDTAQKWFLTAGKPLIALQMRRDALHWHEALRLAKQHAPDEVGSIAAEYAQQLEFTGNYAEALSHYERGLQESKSTNDINGNYITHCNNGIARTSIRCGNFKRGVTLAIESNNQTLQRECAELLENKKQYSDAATLYEKSNSFDKAASVYIKLKNWQKVGEFIGNITSPKLHLEYAVAKEAEGKYEDAVIAYSLAKEYDAVIRLQLEKLNNPEAAVELVQETKSVEGAKMVARFFQQLDDYSSAIRFLVISQCFDEAFQMASKHNKLDLYGEILINLLDTENIRQNDFRSIALHFESERNNLLAGKYYFHAKDYEKAMKHLLRVAKSSNDDNEAISLAIDVVASSNNEILTNELIEFLLGESDGNPKDPKYIFRLYMALKQYREAAKTAIIIANEEQINGNYRNAHDVLFGMYQELKRNRIKIPMEMQSNLMLLHSYILVRIHVRRGDHLKGARMLIRVANNISKFPSHIVPILTSTVIECHRSNLKKDAFTYASMLMRPEYRQQIDPKYAKKIEAIVRKPPKGDYNINEQEPTTPCPYCDCKLPETDMTCSQCKNTLPFCIATGRHIVKDDLSACPSCDFPALRSEFIQLVDSEGACPMCGEKLDPRALILVTNHRLYVYSNDEN